MDEPLPQDVSDRIKDALSQGRKVEGIKIYRSCTGANLTAAVHAIEKLQGAGGQRPPRKFGRSPGSPGPAGIVLTLLIGVIILIAIVLAWLLLQAL